MVNLERAETQFLTADTLVGEPDLLAFSRGAPNQRSSALARVIEADIIPRLLLARGAPVPAQRTATLEVDPDDIDDFAAMMVALDMRRANVVVARALEGGVPVEAVLLDLLAPTAQRLGQMWVDDEATFTDVTVGLCTLQNLLRAVTAGEPEPEAMIDGRVLLAAAPGEQHAFGVLLLEAMYRRAGWDTVGMPMTSAAEIRAMVARQEFSIVGLSLSQESGLGDLAGLIDEVRSASRNPGVIVMVGGRVFNEDSGLVRRVGADLTAKDGWAALVASHNAVCSRVRTH